MIEALITLTSDENSDVRDWACFGLGQMDAASPGARDALAARLTDPDDDTRCEAVLALAKTGDSRAGTACSSGSSLTPTSACFGWSCWPPPNWATRTCIPAPAPERGMGRRR